MTTRRNFLKKTAAGLTAFAENPKKADAESLSLNNLRQSA